MILFLHIITHPLIFSYTLQLCSPYQYLLIRHNFDSCSQRTPSTSTLNTRLSLHVLLCQYINCSRYTQCVSGILGIQAHGRDDA